MKNPNKWRYEISIKSILLNDNDGHVVDKEMY